nr:uncharacterized protein LOC124812521 [Hydra vulgaris]
MEVETTSIMIDDVATTPSLDTSVLPGTIREVNVTTGADSSTNTTVGKEFIMEHDISIVSNSDMSIVSPETDHAALKNPKQKISLPKETTDNDASDKKKKVDPSLKPFNYREKSLKDESSSLSKNVSVEDRERLLGLIMALRYGPINDRNKLELNQHPFNMRQNTRTNWIRNASSDKKLLTNIINKLYQMYNRESKNNEEDDVGKPQSRKILTQKNIGEDVNEPTRNFNLETPLVDRQNPLITTTEDKEEDKETEKSEDEVETQKTAKTIEVQPKKNQDITTAIENDISKNGENENIADEEYEKDSKKDINDDEYNLDNDSNKNSDEYEVPDDFLDLEHVEKVEHNWNLFKNFDRLNCSDEELKNKDGTANDESVADSKTAQTNSDYLANEINDTRIHGMRWKTNIKKKKRKNSLEKHKLDIYK